MMDYIHVHKPAAAVSKTTNTPKRKSTGGRKSIAKKTELVIQNNFYDPTQLSFKAFERKLDETKQKIHEDLFESIYGNTVEYFDYYRQRRIQCNRGTQNLDLDSDDDEKEFIFNPICHVIPSIALFTGINFQDYASLCESLTDRLEAKFTEHVFYISEKNSQNIKSLANSIFSQWANKNESGKKIKRNEMFSFKHLFEDINNTVDSTQPLNSIIFVFKQFELIPKETVEQFVSLVSCYVENIPIYFIIELASQSNILYEQLSSGVISKLCIKRLYLMSPELYLDKFMTKLFIEQSTMFRLSGDILKCLIDTYYEYNFSITSLIHALKFCYYDHLQNHNFNQFYLASVLNEWDLYETMVEQVSKKNIEEKVIYDSLGTHMVSYQEDWTKQSNQFTLICQCLYEIVKNFPSEQENESFFSINIKSFTDFYVKMCGITKADTNKKPFVELPQFSNLKSLLRIASPNTINDIVVSLMEMIKTKPVNNESSYSAEFLNDIHDFEEILEKLKKNFSAQINEPSFNEEDENTLENNYIENNKEQTEMDLQKIVAAVAAKPTLVRRRSSRIVKVLGESNSIEVDNQVMKPEMPPAATTLPLALPKQRPVFVSKKPNSASTKMFTQHLIDWLENQFTIYFNRDYSTQLPNSSYFCYNNFEKFQKRLFDMQRLNLHSCLFNTNGFLNMKINGESPNKKAKNEATTNDLDLVTQNEDPVPLNIVYRVYLECGHMINLFDWLQAFVERVENADLKDLPQQKRKRMQALFFRSITELQFMGFIKPTNRKVDHVVKLTNGSSLLSIDDHNFQIKLNYH